MDFLLRKSRFLNKNNCNKLDFGEFLNKLIRVVNGHLYNPALIILALIHLVIGLFNIIYADNFALLLAKDNTWIITIVIVASFFISYIPLFILTNKVKGE
jgi:hypothetical protein